MRWEVIKFLNWQYDPIRDNAVTAHFEIQGEDWEWVDSSKEKVNRLNTESEGVAIYAGEFYQGAGLAIETWTAPADPALGRHYDHFKDYVFDYNNGKMPQDCDVPYDGAAISEAVPNNGGHRSAEFRGSHKVHNWRQGSFGRGQPRR